MKLSEIPGIGPRSLQKLRAEGILDLERLAAQEPARVAEVLGFPPERALLVVRLARAHTGRGPGPSRRVAPPGSPAAGSDEGPRARGQAPKKQRKPKKADGDSTKDSKKNKKKREKKNKKKNKKKHKKKHKTKKDKKDKKESRKGRKRATPESREKRKKKSKDHRKVK